MSAQLTFFLSTGRCGTQKLADYLAVHVPLSTVVEHEPLKFNYKPAQALTPAARAQLLAETPAIREHFTRLDRLLADGRDYIETGWPCFAWAPYLAEHYEGHVRFIHLVRHPVYFACSMATHSYYRPDRRNDGFIRYAQLNPAVEAVNYPEISLIWNNLSVFEKCLYQWLELNKFILDFTQKTAAPTLTVRFEDLIQGNAFTYVADFLGLGESGTEQEFAAEHVDRGRARTDLPPDPSLVLRHPQVMKLASQLGYDASEFNLEAIRQRYVKPPGEASQKGVAPHRPVASTDVATAQHPKLFNYIAAVSQRPGALPPVIAQLWDAFFSFQRERAIGGDLLDLGAAAGDTALFLADHATDNDTLVMFEASKTHAEEAQKAVGSQLAGRLAVFSDWLEMHQRGNGPYRWMHLAASRTSEEMFEQLMWAADQLAPGGIIVAKDAMLPQFPFRARGLFKTMDARSDKLVPILFGFSSVYLTHPFAAQAYLQFIRDRLPDALGSRGNGDFTLFRMGIPSDMNCFTITQRQRNRTYISRGMDLNDPASDRADQIEL